MRAAVADLAAPAGPAGTDLLVQGQPTAAWLEGFAQANAVQPDHRPVHRRMLQSIAWPAAFATLQVDGEPVGFGLAVLERGTVGLYDIVIAPQRRGLGLGRALVLGLLCWGRGQGAQWAQLQVREPNAAARGLYEGLGFQALYGYHYRLPASVA
jgi:ribosomal protein S18 acetylase RimI-like enzyme